MRFVKTMSQGGFLLDCNFYLVSNIKVLCFLFHIFPKSEIFSVIYLEAVAIILNSRSGQKHCTIHCIQEQLKWALNQKHCTTHCIEEQLKWALKCSKLMTQKEVHQPCPNLVQLYTSILGFRASFSLIITVYICIPESFWNTCFYLFCHLKYWLSFQALCK